MWDFQIPTFFFSESETKEIMTHFATFSGVTYSNLYLEFSELSSRSISSCSAHSIPALKEAADILVYNHDS